MNKFDYENVERLIRLGYPAVAPVIDDMLNWTIDSNWPIADKLAKFLFSLGTPILAPVTALLRGTDYAAKWHCISLMKHRMPKETAALLRPEFERLAYAPSPIEHSEEVDEIATEALAWLDS
jgi:hypothetical protein